jgi:hypothetical protein
MLEIFSFWKELVTNPEKALLKHKGKEDYLEALKIVLPTTLVLSVIVVADVIYGSSGNASYEFIKKLGLPLASVLVWIICIAESFVFNLAYHAVAKLLGGMGSYKGLYYLFAILATAATIAYALVVLLAFIPCLGALAGLAILLYMLYLFFVAIKVEYNLDTVKTIVVVILSPVIGMLMLLITMFLFGMILGVFLYA